MIRIFAAAAAATAALAAGTAAAAPLEAYGKLPSIEQVQISPDGTRLAIVVATDGVNRQMRVTTIGEKSTVIGGVNLGDVKLRGIDWAGSGHVIITVSTTAYAQGVIGRRQEYFMASDYDIATGKQFNLLDNADNGMNVVLGPPQIRQVDGKPTIFVPGVYFPPDQPSHVALYRIDLKQRRPQRIEDGYDDTTEWLVGADGRALAETEYVQRTGKWTLKIKDKSGWRVHRTDDAPIDTPDLLGLGRDGSSVLIGDWNEEEERLSLTEYTAASDKGEPLPPSEVRGVIHDPALHTLIGGRAMVGDELRYTFLSPQGQAQWKSVAKAFPGAQVELVSWSDDRRKIVVKVDSPKEGAAYALIDVDAKRASWIGEVYDAIKPEDVSPTRPIRYKAQDGLEITGYLTVPAGREAKNLPLVVLPHGGPAARDTPEFDWWTQALASRGYAVLRPNFRGSTGFGSKFLAAGFGEWGRKMQTDLSDGVADLAAKGLIDPKRTCIVGASYGGYAALAGATLQSGVYKCAVSVAGVSDLKRFIVWRQADYRSRDNVSLRFWTRFMGADGIKDPNLADISPAIHADRANVPVLLIHGKDDTVVPYVQSEIMAKAMTKAGKPVEFVTLEGEDHWLSKGVTRLQMLKATVAFLERNNPPN
ncbi:peptidase S9 [Caulobacter sp. CCUG 60055]|nr:S9 family peptidase [Caulobacter sp. CCUG 60055]MBQ1542447.1 S9 family peptidase [Caulobacteraceae bacterium]MCI3180974.1 peptidase S9 [Caulobacter sp. CCUG 60055]